MIAPAMDDEALQQDFVDFAATGDPALRSRLVEAHLELASALARRFAKRGEPLDDLEQVAALALVHAVDRFEPERDTAFTSFATRTILGELKRHFRDRGWSVRPPRRIQELCLELNRQVEELTHALGRSPRIDELARACGVGDEEVLEALDAAESYWTTSLDAPGADGEPVGTHVGADDDAFETALQRTTLSSHLEVLSSRDQAIVRLRFELGLTQSEIADLVGLSQMQVSRVLRSSLGTLRAALGVERLVDATDVAD